MTTPNTTESAFRTVLVYQQYAGIEELDCGAAIQHLVVALRHLAEEYACEWPEILTIAEASYAASIVLGSDAAVAVGRFKSDGPEGYRAKSLPDGPLRATRTEAEADERAARLRSANCSHPGGFRADDGRWECSRCGHLFANYEAWGAETGNEAAVAAVKAAIEADLLEVQ